MKVYHGSDTVVQKPRILHSKRRMDFGSGFYTTQSRTQAEKWARSVRRRRDSPEAFVTEFDYEEKPEMNVLISTDLPRNGSISSSVTARGLSPTIAT